MTHEPLPNREGQTVPELSFRIRRDGGWATMTTEEIFGGQNVVVFSLPGAFTPTCSSTHLPRYNELAPAFREAGSRQFTYPTKDGRTMSMGYWTLPESALDDPDEALSWARRSLEVALRSASRRTKS